MAKWDVVLAGYEGRRHYRCLVVGGERGNLALSTRLFGDEKNQSDYTRLHLQGIVGEIEYWQPTYYARYASEVVGNIGHIIEEDKTLEEAIMWLAEPKSALVGCASYKLLAERLEKYPDDSNIVKAKECLWICAQAWKSWRF